MKKNSWNQILINARKERKRKKKNFCSHRGPCVQTTVALPPSSPFLLLSSSLSLPSPLYIESLEFRVYIDEREKDKRRKGEEGRRVKKGDTCSCARTYMA